MRAAFELLGRRRALALALLALAVPLPALALTSDGSDPGAVPAPAALSVATSLDSCGLVETQIVCKLNVSFDQIPGATSYTAAVTRADGSVADYGSIGAGGGSLWVPYVGPGTYSVRVSAYGAPPVAEATGEAGDTGNLITSDTAEAKPRTNTAGNAGVLEDPGARRGDSRAANASVDKDPGADPAEIETPSSSCVPVTDAADEQLPEVPPADLDPANPDEDADGIDDAEERLGYELALTEQQQAALAAAGALPEGVECPTP